MLGMKDISAVYAKHKDLVDNVFWLFFDKVLRMAIGLLVVVWMARYLGPEAFGVLNYAIALVTILTSISSFGLNGVVVRDLVREQDSKPEIIWSAFIIRFSAALISYVCLLIYIFYIGSEDQLSKICVSVLGASILFQSLHVLKCWFESEVKSKYVVWVENSAFLLFSLIKILLIVSESSLVFFAIAAAVEVSIACMLLLLMYLRMNAKAFTFRFHRARLLQLVRDSWPLALSASLATLLLKIDQVMIMDLLGAKEVGVYSAAAKLSELWYFVPVAIAGTLFPSILKSQKISNQVYLNKLGRLYDIMVFCSVFIAIPVSIFSEQIMFLVYGEGYEGAASILSIHIWCSVFVFLRIVTAQWFLINNFQLLTLLRSLTAAILNVSLNYLLIPIYGAEGAAYSLVIALFWATYGFTVLSPRMWPCFVMQTKAMLFVSSFSFIKNKLIR